MSEIEVVHQAEPEPQAVETAPTPAPAPAEVPETPRINKRIQQLVARATAAEERAAAAVTAATNAEKAAQALEARFAATEAKATRESTIRTTYAAAEQAYRAAREAGNVDAEIRAQGQMQSAQAEWAALNGQPAPVAATPAQAPAPQAPAPRQVPNEARQYMTSNAWFGKDRIQTAVAVAISEDLADEGYDPESRDFYDELDKRRQAATAPKAAPAAPARSPTAAPSSPSTAPSGKIRVVLDAEERDMARRLGVSEQDYAKHKAEITEEKPHGEQGPTMISWRAA